MPHETGAYLGGIRTLEGLRIRCRMCEESGCWIWGMAMVQGSPKVHITIDGVSRGGRGRWAAKSLEAGAFVERGLVVYAACKDRRCVNPAHARVGTQSQAKRAAAKRGAYKTAAKMASFIRIAAKRRKLTDQDVRDIRASQESTTELMKRYPVSRNHINSVRAGRLRRDLTMPIASVFAWRGEPFRSRGG